MLDTIVGRVRLPSPIIVGAGVIKTFAQAVRWLPAITTVCGSYAPLPRAGNEGVTFYPNNLVDFLRSGAAVNWMGLPDPGILKAARWFRSIPTFDHPLIVSVAGFTIHELVDAITKLDKIPAIVALKINFSCPNTDGGGVQSDSLPFMHAVLEGVGRARVTKPLWVQVSHYRDEAAVAAAAGLFRHHVRLVPVVVASNTYPYAGNTLGVTTGDTTPPEGQGGISGPVILPLALTQVQWFARHLPPSIHVVGSGGVTTGDDVIQYFEHGARAVECTTLPYLLQNPQDLWDRLLQSPRLASRLYP